jgi:hypothetical protein
MDSDTRKAFSVKYALRGANRDRSIVDVSSFLKLNHGADRDGEPALPLLYCSR